VVEEFASGAVVHDHVELVLVLEGVVELDDEGMVVLLHDLLLKVGVHLVLVLFDEVLPDGLHSLHFVVKLAPYQLHFTLRPFSQHLYSVEIVVGYFPLV